jgi:hypothetical protein
VKRSDLVIKNTASKKRTVLSDKFELVGDAALDARKRVSLSKAFASANGHLPKSSTAGKNGDLRFQIHMNKAGQILLTPQSIDPREAWFYRNPKAQATLRRAIRQAAEGRLHHVGSFAKYAEDEID